MSLSLDELRRFAAALAESPQRWRHLVRHADDARVYEQIWDDEDVNAWVMDAVKALAYARNKFPVVYSTV